MNRAMCQIFGTATVELIGAWPERCLSRFAALRLPMDQVEKVDELTCRVRLLQRDLKRAEAVASKCGCEFRILQRAGLRTKYGGLKRRVALYVGLAVILTAALTLPQFIWTMEVSGNSTIPEDRILRELESLGIGFGTYGPSIDSQDVKNHMLARIPELEWLAINRSGGRAVVEVRERAETPEMIDMHTITNVVAARTGIITNAQVYAGKSMVKEGQTVLQGELLVSGVAEWINRTQYSHAMAEIYARTWHKTTAVLPQTYTAKDPTGETEVCRTLILGKKRIKLSGNSSFSQSNCDKIITESALTLPGGIELPIRLETVTCVYYEPVEETMPDVDAYALLAEESYARIRSSLLAGEILNTSCVQEAADGLYYYTTVAECSEQIAMEVPVETYEGEP